MPFAPSRRSNARLIADVAHDLLAAARSASAARSHRPCGRLRTRKGSSLTSASTTWRSSAFSATQAGGDQGLWLGVTSVVGHRVPVPRRIVNVVRRKHGRPAESRIHDISLNVMQSVDLVIPNFQGEQLLDDLPRRGRRPDAAARARARRRRRLDRRLAREVVARHAGVEWLPLAENRGFPAAVNAGIAASTAPLIALLNTDALPEPGWLEALVRALDADASHLARRLAHALPRRHGQRRRRLVRRARPGRLQPRPARARRAGASTSRASSSAPAPAPRSTGARCSPTSGSSTRPSGSRGRTSTSTCARCSPGTAACTSRTRWCSTRRASSSGAARLALERRNKAWLALRGLPAAAARALPRAGAAARGLRGARRARGVPRLARAARSRSLREAPRAARWRRTVSRRVPSRALLPLLASESQPYEAAAASSSRQNARNASASRDGSREAGRTST